MSAPNCQHSGCTNPTWNPNGMCHHHQGSSSEGSWIPPVNDMPIMSEQASPSSGFSSEIHDQARRAFPDIDDEVHPASIRKQSVIALQSGVSVEVYRRFPHADFENVEDRQNALRQYHHEIVELSHITPSEMDDDNAALMSYSSEDSYGRSFQESSDLAAWGVRKEWELANSMGITHDDQGVEYGDDYEQYVERVSKTYSNVVSDEYMRQLVRFPRIVEEVKSKPPRNSTPVFPDNPVNLPPIPSSEKVYLRKNDPAYIRQQRVERGQEAAKTAAHYTGVAARKGFGMAKNYLENRAEQRERERPLREEQRRQREEEKIRREEAELRRLQKKELKASQRERRGFF